MPTFNPLKVSGMTYTGTVAASAYFPIVQSSGGVLTNFYTQTAALSSNFVDFVSTQSIGGNKNFTNLISANAGLSSTAGTFTGLVSSTLGVASSGYISSNFWIPASGSLATNFRNAANTSTNFQITDSGSVTIGGYASQLNILYTQPQTVFLYGGYIQWGATGVNPPSFTTSSTGTKLLLYGNISGTSADYAIGIQSSAMWLGVPTTSQSFYWYGGTTAAAILTGTGNLTLTGGIVSTTGAFSTNVTAGGAYVQTTGDIGAARATNVGCYWFGTSSSTAGYIYYDGTNFDFGPSNTFVINQSLGIITITGGAGNNSIYLSNATSQWIYWNSAGVAAPAFTTRSAGTKLVLFPSLSGTTVDYAIGINSSTMWFSVAAAASQFQWYGATSVAATLTGAGVLTLATPLAISSGGTGLTTGFGLAATTSNVATSNTSELQVVGATIAANTLNVGTTIAIRARGQATVSVAGGTITLRSRIGTTTLTGNIITSIADTTVVGTAVTFTLDILITVRSTGSSGTIIGIAQQTNTTTGLTASNIVFAPPAGTAAATVAVNTTVANILELTVQTSATTSTPTFYIAEISIEKQ